MPRAYRSPSERLRRHEEFTAWREQNATLYNGTLRISIPRCVVYLRDVDNFIDALAYKILQNIKREIASGRGFGGQSPSAATLETRRDKQKSPSGKRVLSVTKDSWLRRYAKYGGSKATSQWGYDTGATATKSKVRGLKKAELKRGLSGSLDAHFFGRIVTPPTDRLAGHAINYNSRRPTFAFSDELLARSYKEFIAELPEKWLSRK